MVTDPIADMLTQIRNANRTGVAKVALPASRMQVEVARVLKEEGYIAGYQVEPAGPAQKLEIQFKARQQDRGQTIAGLKRISRPGLRVYARKTEIPRVLGGLGIVILSTSRGLMSGRQAQKAGLGGEVVCYVW
jgi:small subunit ribosomal protein S8